MVQILFNFSFILFLEIFHFTIISFVFPETKPKLIFIPHIIIISSADKFYLLASEMRLSALTMIFECTRFKPRQFMDSLSITSLVML